MFWWTHGESNPDFQNAILTSFLWTMSPWCRPPVLPRILLVFSQACDFYTRAARILAARAGVEPAATCFRDRAPYRHRVPGNGDTDGC
jgi:hypothetical protein